MPNSEGILSPINVPVSSNSQRGRIAMVSTHGYVAAEPPLGMPDTGGQVVYVVELSKKLAEFGYQVDIWTRQFEDQPASEEVSDGVTIIRIPCGGKDFIPKEYLYKKLPEFISRATEYIQKHDIEYNFINSHYWDAGIAGQAMADFLECPHTHTPHSLGSWKQQQMETDFPQDKDKFEEKYNFSNRIKHESEIYAACDTLVATTPMQIDYFLKDYGSDREKIHMIPPGYDDSRFYPVSAASRTMLRDQLGFTDKKVITSIGRLSRNKGFDLLVDAFSVVAQRMPNAYLSMALGTESDDPKDDRMLQAIVQKVKDLGLQQRVNISPSLPEEAMPDFYRAGDVFCLPSRYEPFGMTAIEAMACGTPTVVTTNGGLYRALEFGKDALFADSFDKEDYGITIMKALKHRALWRKLSDQGALKTRSLFTWTGIAQQLINAVETRKLPKIIVSDPIE